MCKLTTCDRAEALLAGSVPYLQLDPLAIEEELLYLEIYPAAGAQSVIQEFTGCMWDLRPVGVYTSRYYASARELQDDSQL